jgi:hypothetical protein
MMSLGLYQVHWPIDVNSMAHFAGGHGLSLVSLLRRPRTQPATQSKRMTADLQM